MDYYFSVIFAGQKVIVIGAKLAILKNHNKVVQFFYVPIHLVILSTFYLFFIFVKLS